MEVLGHPYRMSSNVFHRTLNRSKTDLDLQKIPYSSTLQFFRSASLPNWCCNFFNQVRTQKKKYILKTLLFVIQMLHHTYCYLSSKRYITLTKLIWESGVMSLNIFRNIFITKSAIMYLPKSWNICRKHCYLSFKCYITQTKSIWKSDKVRRTSLCNVLEYILELF